MTSALRRKLRALTSILWVAACSPQSSDAQRAGAQISTDVILDWHLSVAWSVGGAVDTTLFLATLHAKDIAVSNGALLLVDRDRSQIARYASDGDKLSSIGRGDGSGPGELSFPRSIAVDPDGRIIVEDRGNGRVSYFNANGRDLKHRPHDSGLSISQLRAVTDSSLIGLVEMTDSITLASLTGHRLRTITSIQAPRRLGTARVCSTTGYEFNTLFSPTILFATAGSILAVTTGDGEVSFYRGDRHFSTHEHAFPRRRTNDAMARAHLGEGIRIQVQGMPPCTVPTALVLEAGELAPELPAYSSLAIDPDGVVWATRYAVGKEPAVADVFDSKTGYVGTVAVGAARPVAFLSRSLMVSLETDDDGVPVVRVYRVAR